MSKPGPKRYAWNHAIIVARFKARCTPCKCGCVLFDNDNGDGYARFRANDFPACASNLVLAHRYAWALAFGEIPENHDIHHRHDVCKHSNCVNPKHLESIGHAAHGLLSRGHQQELAAEAFEYSPDDSLTEFGFG